jgi:hypothetical protein
MKKLLVVLGVVALMSTVAFAAPPNPGPGTYFVDYFANNVVDTDGVPAQLVSVFDQWIRVVNVGLNGTPLTSPVGDICANYYVFDNQQEMAACCSCRITPDEYRAARVGADLTANPLTPIIPRYGVVKVVTTPYAGSCDPTAALAGASADLARVWGTHLQITGGATFVTETEKLPATLSDAEASFLPTACSFVQYLGSGFGVCRCNLATDGTPVL